MSGNTKGVDSHVTQAGGKLCGSPGHRRPLRRAAVRNSQECVRCVSYSTHSHQHHNAPRSSSYVWVLCLNTNP